MRNTTLLAGQIANRCRQVPDGDTAPDHADGKLLVELHVVASCAGPKCGLQRIDAEPALGVADDRAPRLEVHPEAADAAAERAPAWLAPVEDRLAQDQRLGSLPRSGDEARNVVQIVLPVGIHLQDVAEARLGGQPEARLHSRALSTPPRSVVHAREALLGQRLAGRAALGPAAVVHHQDVVQVLSHLADHGAHRSGVVEGGDQCTGPEAVHMPLLQPGLSPPARRSARC